VKKRTVSVETLGALVAMSDNGWKPHATATWEGYLCKLDHCKPIFKFHKELRPLVTQHEASCPTRMAILQALESK